jgi:parallel beta-helix repeat protein
MKTSFSYVGFVEGTMIMRSTETNGKRKRGIIPVRPSCRFDVLVEAFFCAVLLGLAGPLDAETKSPSLILSHSTQTVSLNPGSESQVVTVGGSGADIPAFTSEAIQLAVDTLKSRGTGTVKLGAGTFDVIAPVRLASGISLVGAGDSTVLRKADGYRSAMSLDCGYGELKVVVKNPRGFKVGMGVIIRDTDSKGGWDPTTTKITAIDGNTLYIDNYTVKDYQSGKDAVVSNACSLVEAVECENIRIANLAINGGRQTNDLLDGCRSGGIYLHKSKNCTVENVKVRSFNGDGISWQITEDITVSSSEVNDCGNFGFHPGTGSVRTKLENCISHDNGTDGIFVCWRVRNGSFTGNSSYHNGGNGISIGHKDTDNLFVNNRIYENGEHGVYFRKEIEQNGAHRNSFRDNVVENNGTKSGGYGFYVDGATADILIEHNTIRNTAGGAQKAGVFIGEQTSRVRVVENQMSGHEKSDVVEASRK